MSDIVGQVLRTNIYIQPMQLILAISTNILNIRILCCRPLRRSPCAYYFIAYAVYSILYSCLICPTLFLRAFDINWANDKFGCKFNAYILFVVPFQANLMLVFAAIDRYCSSIRSRRLNSASTIQIAKITTAIGSILCAIYVTPMLFIYYWDSNTNRCLVDSNLPIKIYILSQVVLYGIIDPFLMIVFGLLTISNIRQQSNRVLPLSRTIRKRRMEGSLTRMLLLQVIVHLIFAIPFAVVYSMNTFDPSTQTPLITAIRLALVSWQQCDYFISFFLYILSSKLYRRQLFRIVKSLSYLTTIWLRLTRYN